MKFIADFHIHSRFSRATAQKLDLENLYIATQLKAAIFIKKKIRLAKIIIWLSFPIWGRRPGSADGRLLSEIFIQTADPYLVWMPKSKTVQNHYRNLLNRFGSEYNILHGMSTETIERSGATQLAEAIYRMRRGELSI